MNHLAKEKGDYRGRMTCFVRFHGRCISGLLSIRLLKGVNQALDFYREKKAPQSECFVDCGQNLRGTVGDKINYPAGPYNMQPDPLFLEYCVLFG